MNAPASYSYTCPHCRKISYHPDDAVNRYCAACHRFTVLNECGLRFCSNKPERNRGVCPDHEREFLSWSGRPSPSWCSPGTLRAWIELKNNEYPQGVLWPQM